jgi:hypothetical protein
MVVRADITQQDDWLKRQYIAYAWLLAVYALVVQIFTGLGNSDAWY